MPITVDPVPSDIPLPTKVDVVIVGGGIIGASTAYFLAQQGLKPLVCEKGVVAGEQSGRNWGWCRTMGRDPRELPLAIESLGLWRSFKEQAGIETGFRNTGIAYICPDEAALARREAWLPHAREHGLESRLLTGAELDRLLPGATVKWPGALFTPGDGVAEPTMAAPAIAHAARRAGALIVTGCAVRSIDVSTGRASGVVTEQGRVDCDAVVLAGGAWTSLLCRTVGIRLPQLKVRSTVLRTTPCPDGPGIAAWCPGLAFRPRLDGGYTVARGRSRAEITPDSFRFLIDFLPVLRQEWGGIGMALTRYFFSESRYLLPQAPGAATPFEKVRVLDPRPSARDQDTAFTNLVSTFPAFASTSILERWAGLIDVSPDLVPVISPIDSLPGLFVSTGYSGHGFGIGPGAGRLTADLVSGRDPVVDPSPFRFSRFSDGSPVTLHASL
ncbi:MAG: FAD-binding oxidoreductase [Arenicellales bacterium]